MEERRQESGKAIERAFGRLLRQWRDERGLSQERLAELSGCDRSYLSRLERGINAPSLTVMVELATALGIRPGDLLAQVGVAIDATAQDQAS